MSSVFVTGFPGFLASEVIPRITMRCGRGIRIDCLALPRLEQVARLRAQQISEKTGAEIRVRLGDITARDLGLGSALDSVRRSCREIFHFAAIYDLAVPLDAATAVNVEGTRHVLELARSCASLERFHHVSTCYVSGPHEGTFRETDLQIGQSWSNHYESTKYESEVLVQHAASLGLPTTIYRPSIVTGNSKSGRSQKMDGAYFLIQWILVQPRFALIPVFRGARDATMNIVPSDYVADAIAYLSSLRNETLTVYSLADPDPLPISRLAEGIAEAADRKAFRVPSTRWLARAMIRTVSRVRGSVNIPSQAVEYLGHPTRYDCTNAQRDLSAAGISCPAVWEYLPKLVRFVTDEWQQVAGG